LNDAIFKFQDATFFRGSALDPAGGANSAPPDPLAGGEGARCPLPKNSSPLSALRASHSANPHFIPRRRLYVSEAYIVCMHFAVYSVFRYIRSETLEIRPAILHGDMVPLVGL